MQSVFTNTKTYSEYPEVAHRMDSRQLYKQLDIDTVERELMHVDEAGRTEYWANAPL